MTVVAPTYRIVADTIVCLLCGSMSANSGDVRNRYCGRCHLSHDLVQSCRQSLAEGATHDCGEWRTARGLCALCDRVLDAPDHAWLIIPCPCGEPWPDLQRYDPQAVRYIEQQVRALGELVPVTIGARTFRVSRRCIAYHGIKANDLTAGRSGWSDTTDERTH